MWSWRFTFMEQYVRIRSSKLLKNPLDLTFAFLVRCSLVRQTRNKSTQTNKRRIYRRNRLAWPNVLLVLPYFRFRCRSKYMVMKILWQPNKHYFQWEISECSIHLRVLLCNMFFLYNKISFFVSIFTRDFILPIRIWTQRNRSNRRTFNMWLANVWKRFKKFE